MKKLWKVVLVFIICLLTGLATNNALAAASYETEGGCSHARQVNGQCVTCGECFHPNLSSNYSFRDQNDHWKKCYTCGKEVGRQKHTSKERCSICGYKCEHIQYTPKYDELSHWQECDNCGFVKEDDFHDWSPEDWCEVCVDKAEQDACTNHNYIPKFDGFYHWEECDKCGYATEDEIHNIPSKDWCPVCQCLNHNYIPKFDNAFHWQECSNCGYVNNWIMHNLSPKDWCEVCTGANDVCTHVLEWTTTPTTHEKKCSICQTIVVASEKHGEFNLQNECIECGYKCTQHNYQKKWNENTHYKECICGATADIGAHKASPKSWCEVCAGVKAEKNVCEHDNKLEKWDVDLHWKECEKCQTKLSVAPHRASPVDWCEVCTGVKDETEAKAECPHPKLSDGYSFEQEYHWKKCDICGEEVGRESHNYIPESASYAHWKKCVCGSQIEYGKHEESPKDWCITCQCQHNYIPKVYQSHHWQYCTNCGNIKEYGTHEESPKDWCEVCTGVKDETEAKAECPHPKLSDGYSFDQEYHWKKCYVCGAQVGSGEPHNYILQFTADAHFKKCVCGREEVGSREPHNYISQFTDDTHFKKCICGKVVDIGSHKNSPKDWCEVCAGVKDETEAKSECIHQNQANGRCISCGECLHVNLSADYSFRDQKDHWKKCYGCGKEVYKASHEWVSGKCKICSYKCSHTWSGNKCTNCGYTIQSDDNYEGNIELWKDKETIIKNKTTMKMEAGKEIIVEYTPKDKFSKIKYQITVLDKTNQILDPVDIVVKDSSGNYKDIRITLPDKEMKIRLEVVGILVNGKETEKKEYSFNLVEKEKDKVVEETEDKVMENVTDWAQLGVMNAAEEDLIPEKLYNVDSSANIARAEFAAIAVKVYEAVLNPEIVFNKENPFMDTTDEDVSKAFELGIVSGMTKDEFMPNLYINREQMATMMLNTIKKLEMKEDINLEEVEKFKDHSEIYDWAIESVYYMKATGIMKGALDNKFEPKQNATREQAIVMASNCYEYLMKLRKVSQDSVKEEPVECTHIWSSYYYVDLSGHTRTCELCGTTDAKVEHNTNGGYKNNVNVHWKLCSICNNQGEASSPHTAGSNWQKSEQEHWKVCTTCNRVMNSATHTMIPSDRGNYCSTCGYNQYE